jgi:predicted ATPase
MMMPNVPNRFILTGAPGTGKTAILDTLRSSLTCVDEAAREVLAEQRATGGVGTWDQDPSRFVELLLQRSIDRFEEAGDEAVLFDRGVPDCVAYAVLADVDPTPSLEACERYRYHHEVLILEPWEDIYVTDEERTMSFGDTSMFHRSLVDAYEGAGYALVDVPRAPLNERAAFVRGFIGAARGRS